MNSYAVAWSGPDGSLGVGKLELGAEGLRLDGAAPRTIPYGEIERARVGRRLSERIGGKPALLLQLASGGVVAIVSIAGPGMLGELAERLAPRLVA